MIATPATPPLPDDGTVYARHVLNVAAEVEAAEARIKAEIIAAAQTGDCDRVINIVTRWQTLASCEVLPRHQVAECGDE